MGIRILYLSLLFIAAACSYGEPVPPYPLKHAETSLICPNRAEASPQAERLLADLKVAVEQKDAAFIKELIADDIKFSFGGDYGKDAFLREWNLDSRKSMLWGHLAEMLRLGGYMQSEDAIVFPCTFHELSPENWVNNLTPPVSAFDYLVVVNEEGTELTGKDDKPLRYLKSGEIVLRSATKGVYRTHDGLVGHVDEKDLRSPVDYRMFLNRIGGKWKITLFIAGD